MIYCERQTHKQIITIPHNKGCHKGAQIGCEDNNSMINSLEKLALSSEALVLKFNREPHSNLRGGYRSAREDKNGVERKEG